MKCRGVMDSLPITLRSLDQRDEFSSFSPMHLTRRISIWTGVLCSRLNEWSNDYATHGANMIQFLPMKNFIAVFMELPHPPTRSFAPPQEAPGRFQFCHESSAGFSPLANSMRTNSRPPLPAACVRTRLRLNSTFWH